MVFVNAGAAGAQRLAAFPKERGILISAGDTIRPVTHLDIDD